MSSNPWASRIREEIYSLKGTMSDEELFASDAFAMHLQEVQETALGPAILRKREVTLKTCFDPNSDFTAKTDGTTVETNTFGPLTRNQTTRQDRYFSNIGQIVHEDGHVLFTDFPVAIAHRQAYLHSPQFYWYPREPKDPAQAKRIAEYLNTHPIFRMYFGKLFVNVQNIYEDAYIENRMCLQFAGIFAYGISIGRREKYHLSSPLEEILQNVVDQKEDLVEAVLQLMHVQSLRFPPKTDPTIGMSAEMEKQKQQIQKVLADIQIEAEDLQTEMNAAIRAEKLNEIMMVLFAITKREENTPEEPAPQEESSQENAEHPQSTADLGWDQARSMVNQLEQTLQKQGLTCPAKGNTSPIKMRTKPKQKELLHAAEAAYENSKQKSSIETVFASAEKEVIEKAAQSIVQEEFANSIKNDAEDIMAKFSDGKPMSWHYRVYMTPITEQSVLQYQKIYQKVESEGIGIKRELKQHLEQLEKKTLPSRGHSMGRFDCRSVATHAFLEDGKVFTRRDVRNHKPDIVFGLRIDCSASMNNKKKIETAKQIAILFDDLLYGIHVPYFVIGDDAQSTTCRLFVCHEFEDIDHQDRYRIANLCGGEWNRDGASLTYCAEKLLKRPERKKVLISISDGLPTENSYFYGKDLYLEDTKAAVKHYTEQGIEIFGVVIDGNVSQIAEIYGERTMNLTHLEHVSEELMGLIQRYVLRT